MILFIILKVMTPQYSPNELVFSNDPVSPKLTPTQTSYYHAIKDFNSLSQTIRECEYF